MTGLLYSEGDMVNIHVRTTNDDAIQLTDENGLAVFEGMYLGQYVVKETNIPYGYVSNSVETPFTLVQTDYTTQDVEAVEGLIEVYNILQKAKIQVTKHDMDDPDIVLEGAKFGLYAGENIKNKNGDVLIAKNTLIETAVTDEDGVARFSTKVPTGLYYIEEESAPLGYTNSIEWLDVDASYDPSGAEYVEVSLDFYNEITKVEILKKDIDTDELMEGATMAVTDAFGETVDTWVTDGEVHLIKGLYVGNTYTLVETEPAKGYATADPVTFTVLDRTADGQYEPQQIEMYDPPIIITVTAIDKDTEEVLDGVKVNVYDENGESVFEDVDLEWVQKHIPIGSYTIEVTEVPEGYVIPDPTVIEVKDTADIQDFVIPIDHIKVKVRAVDEDTNEPVDDVTVDIYDENGEKIYEDVPLEWAKEYLPAGHYTIEVTEVPEGYVLPDDPTEIDVIETGDWQEFEIPLDHIKVKVRAVDEETGEPVDDVTVDIYDENGEKIYEDVPLEWAKEYLPAGHYTIEVKTVPDGYVIPDEPTEIDVIETGDWQEFEIPLDHIKVKVRAVDEETGDPLDGVIVNIYDPEGNLLYENVDLEWAKEYLPAGEYLIEVVEVPDGYAIPDEMFPITVIETGDWQEFEIPIPPIMIEIDKVDSETGKSLSGAKLTLTDENGEKYDSWTTNGEPYVIDRIPAGTYTLTETVAPDGYASADPMTIVVKAIADTQTFTMYDEPIKEAVPSVSDGTPTVKTGDDFNGLGLIVSLAMIMALGITGYSLSDRKKKRAD